MKHFIIDFETLGLAPNPILVELSVIAFDVDDKSETFESLVSKGLKIKFDIKSQQAKGRRYTNKSTLDFWKNQPESLREELLLPSDNDVDLKTGFEMFVNYLSDQGVTDIWNTTGWCRGQSFDFPILIDMIREVTSDIETDKHEPCKFWNQCDIRSFIRGCMGSIHITDIPLLKSEVPGFTAHNSIHDCAKDIIMIKRAYAISRGADFMAERDLDKYEPSTIKTRQLNAYKESLNL